MTAGGVGSVVLAGPIGDAYAASGGASGPWGVPTSVVSTIVTTHGTGQGQNYSNGQALSSSAGTFLVPKSVQSVHGANGWVRGDLGWPTAAASCTGGACSQQFQGGTISVTAGGVGSVTSD